MEKYIPQDIEKKWQGVWAESHADKTPDDNGKPPYYVLEMFPFLRETCIWGMCVTTLSVMLLPAIAV